ncbi:alpha-L-fucosidase 1 [Selaginella moellendorffii]|uniref:alpha-L-fucosidase 1 n=1 Tax=Selaginella moellendorffii TaxID=88036 RepID=UPI000D1CE543|nr:alpha-L-fucosidase 1 [Selaginella moellendorffii]|eukprot:XP_024536023.1 alpha-L-fucosidase 1 [Selaginella moellendorffii]
MDAAQSAGAQLVILTVKHHDGFCLWPSAYTNFSVASSSWRGGKGDVVAEFVAAARERGLDVGFYLSPWDLHESCYGDTLLYNEFYRELLTGYGPISEVWLDGAKSPTAVNMSYDFELWFDTIHPRCKHLFRC